MNRDSSGSSHILQMIQNFIRSFAWAELEISFEVKKQDVNSLIKMAFLRNGSEELANHTYTYKIFWIGHFLKSTLQSFFFYTGHIVVKTENSKFWRLEIECSVIPSAQILSYIKLWIILTSFSDGKLVHVHEEGLESFIFILWHSVLFT